MRRHFLIDFENVSDEGLKGFSSLTPEDTVELFYTQNANKITIEFFSGVQALPKHAELRFLPVAAGNQALDLQLATYLGHVIADGSAEYCVVSKDKGYEHVIGFWKALKPEVRVVMHKSIADCLSAGTPKPAKAKSSETAAKTKKAAPAAAEAKPAKTDAAAESGLDPRVKETLTVAGYDTKLVSDVASIVARNSASPQAKSVIHTEIVGVAGQEEGSAIYKLIKGFIA